MDSKEKPLLSHYEAENLKMVTIWATDLVDCLRAMADFVEEDAADAAASEDDGMADPYYEVYTFTGPQQSDAKKNPLVRGDAYGMCWSMGVVIG